MMRHEQLGGNWHSNLPKCRTWTSSNPGFLPEVSVLTDIFMLEDGIFLLNPLNYTLSFHVPMKFVCGTVWHSKHSCVELNQRTKLLSNFQSRTPSSCSFSNTIALPGAFYDIHGLVTKSLPSSLQICLAVILFSQKKCSSTVNVVSSSHILGTAVNSMT